LLALLAVNWQPVYTDLMLGQLTLPILTLILGMRWALVRGRPLRAGGLVGLSVLIKLMPILLLGWLARHGQWRALGAAVTVIAGGYLAAAALLGPGPLVDYALRVAPALSHGYQGSAENISLWTLGERVFRGATADGFHVKPLLPLGLEAIGAPILAGLLVLGVIMLLWRARRADTNTDLGIFVCLTILLSPIAWEMYIVLAALPVVQLFTALRQWRWPRARTVLAAAFALLLAAPDTTRYSLLIWQAQADGEVAFAIGLLTLTASIGVAGIAVLLATLPRSAVRTEHAGHRSVTAVAVR
jgi:hypothetical protein